MLLLEDVGINSTFNMLLLTRQTFLEAEKRYLLVALNLECSKGFPGRIT